MILIINTTLPGWLILCLLLLLFVCSLTCAGDDFVRILIHLDRIRMELYGDRTCGFCRTCLHYLKECSV